MFTTLKMLTFCESFMILHMELNRYKIVVIKFKQFL